MSYYKFDGTDDVLDSRDIEERINEIEQEHGHAEDEAEQRQDFISRMKDYDVETAEEYEALIELREDVQGSANEGWEHGVTLVRKDYADGNWAQERAHDFGVFQVENQGYGLGHPGRATASDLASRWPFTHIDWDAAADALREDAAEFDFRGSTYFED